MKNPHHIFADMEQVFLVLGVVKILTCTATSKFLLLLVLLVLAPRLVVAWCHQLVQPLGTNWLLVVSLSFLSGHP